MEQEIKQKIPEEMLQIIKEKEPTEEEAKEMLKKAYELIIKVLKRYSDLKEEYYNIIALWIIGTYMHKKFVTFPYLFFNAMKGSGKSRTIKLILYLSHNGVMGNSLSESVLFRTASQRTLGIDEFEHVGSKEKGLLRELLNSAYKKGTCVERARKSYKDDGESYEIEKYDVYCPILMANITGMEEVLSDRCISLILEKSGNNKITRLLELFEEDDDILEIKRLFSVVSVVTLPSEICKGWNTYLLNNNDTIDTHNTNDTIYTNDTTQDLYIKIDKSGIDSRNLELFFPLFIISSLVGQEILEKTIITTLQIVNEKKDEDFMENRDVSLIDFIASSESMLEAIANDFFVREKDILEHYRNWVEYDEHNDEFKWLNSKWIGRALKRLNLTIDKKRTNKGRAVRLNFEKARFKAGMFKHEEKVQ